MKSVEQTRRKDVILMRHNLATNHAVTAPEAQHSSSKERRPPRKALESKPFAKCVALKAVIKKPK